MSCELFVSGGNPPSFPLADISDTGRSFAEREVIAFAAAILATWEIEPVDGKWIYPGAKLGSGTVNPVKDVRVRMRRRRQ